MGEVTRRIRRRHPCERGNLLQRSFTAAMRDLTARTMWVRHSEPFAKRKEGKARRSARKFVVMQTFAMSAPDPSP